jgi:flagellar motility protein MotE (MotC chaperone)
MSNLPRILPLIAIAIGGVLAVRVVGSIDALPDMFKSATAWAEGAEPKAAPKPATPSKTETSQKASDVAAAEEAAVAEASATSGGASDIKDIALPAATKSAAPVCPTSIDDLAKQAGMSPTELTVLQSLGTRRAELEEREKQMNSQEQLIKAAEGKLDGRIKQMGELKAQIQALLDQASKAADDDVSRMVKVYESMKPKDAAKVMETLKDDVRIPIAAKMKERNLAAILAQMRPDAARDLTEKLAGRLKKADGLQSQLDKVNAPSQSSGQAPAKTPQKPAPQTPAPKKST